MAEQGGSLLARLFSGKGGSDDAGRGRLEDYDYNHRPKRNGTTIRLADSNPHQDELQRLLDTGVDEIWAMISRRTPEEERVDAPMPVRIFANSRVSGIVGIVPRGLEAPVDDTIVRIVESGKPPRIPAAIVNVKGVLRLDLLVGQTR